MARLRSPLVRRVRDVVGRVGVLVAIASLLVALFVQGSRYVWCPLMERPFWSSCCDGVHAGHGRSEGPAVVDPRCCEDRAFGGVPTGTESEAPSLAPAPLLAVLTTHLDSLGALEEHKWALPPPPSGPPPPLPHRLALLSVYRL